MRKILITTLACFLFACKPSRHRLTQAYYKAEKLVDSAVRLGHVLENGKMSRSEHKQLNLDQIKLLNQAINIDSAHLSAYEIKIDCESELMQWDSIISTGKRVLRITPHNARITLYIGQCFELKGDTSIAKNYYREALSLISKKEAKLKSNNLQYQLVMEYKARALILLRRDAEGRAIFKEFYENPSFDDRERFVYKMDYMRTREKFVRELMP